MGVHVLFNLLDEVGKRIKNKACSALYRLVATILIMQ